MRLGLQAGPYRPHVHQLTLLGSAAPQRRTYPRTTWVGPCCAATSWTSASASGVIVPTPTSTLAYPSSDKCASSRMGGELLTGCRMPNHDLTLRIIRASMSDICRYSTLGMTVFQSLVGVKKVFLRGARAGDPNWESRDPACSATPALQHACLLVYTTCSPLRLHRTRLSVYLVHHARCPGRRQPRRQCCLFPIGTRALSANYLLSILESAPSSTLASGRWVEEATAGVFFH